MTSTIDPQTAFARVTQSGKLAARHERRTEILRAICFLGAHIRQGDVVLEFLGDSISVQEMQELRETSERQLAPGNTQGSRHILEGDARVYLRPDERGDGTTGPLIVTGESLSTVTHPEHRHYTLPPNTMWGVCYELDEATKRRVQD